MNPYTTVIHSLVPRILSMQNRNPMSSTHGCFDRNFWHFKTIIDFPSATYQQVVLGLSKLYATESQANPYFKHPVIKDSIVSGILYWAAIQNHDGSFNEYYENDSSFCPTAFTTYAVANAYYLTSEIFSEDEQSIIIKAYPELFHFLLHTHGWGGHLGKHVIKR